MGNSRGALLGRFFYFWKIYIAGWSRGQLVRLNTEWFSEKNLLMPIAQEKSRYTIKLCVEAGSSPAGVANLKVGGSNPSPATI